MADSKHPDGAAKINQITQELQRTHLQEKDVNLDNMSAEQKAQLAAMKQVLKSSNVQGVESDVWLLKYLKFNGFNGEKAAEAYKNMKEWRVKTNVAGMVASGKTPQGDLMRRVVPYGYVGYDKEGCPVYLEKSGKIHVDALVNHVSDEAFILSHTFGMENLRRMMDESSKKTGRQINQFTTVIDLDGLGLYHRNAIPLLQKVHEFDCKYYPDFVGQIFVINSPWVMPVLWEMIKVFLDEHTKAKIHVCGVNYKEELLRYIDADQLPAEYGGTAENIRTYTVPEMKELLLRDSSGLHLSEIQIPAGASFELELTGDVGATFQWSFDVSGGYDIAFSISIRNAEDATGAGKPLKQESRCQKNKGEFVATAASILTLKWDNSYSYFNSKDLKYHASVSDPNEK